MRTTWAGFAAVFFTLAAFANEARAAAHGTVYVTGTNTATAGTISASGNVTPDCGWSLAAFQMFVVPKNGGLQLSTLWNNPPAAGGNWGLTINNLSAQQYYVWGWAQFTSGGNSNFVISSFNLVTLSTSAKNPTVPPGTVSYASGDPQGGVGKVLTANKGTYTITTAGYTGTSCSFQALPVGGGEVIDEVNGTLSACGGTLYWSATTIAGLSGHYWVTESVTMTKCGVPKKVYSSVIECIAR